MSNYERPDDQVHRTPFRLKNVKIQRSSRLRTFIEPDESSEPSANFTCGALEEALSDQLRETLLAWIRDINGRTSWVSLSLEQEEKTSRLWKIIGQMWDQIKIKSVCYDTIDKEFTYISGHCALCDLQMNPRYSCKQCGLEDVCEECMLTVQCLSLIHI